MRKLALAVLALTMFSCSDSAKKEEPIRAGRPSATATATVAPTEAPEIFVDPDVTRPPEPTVTQLPIGVPGTVVPSTGGCIVLDTKGPAKVGEKFTFKGKSKCPDRVLHLEITVDEWPIGTTTITANDTWELDYTFEQAGEARDLVINGFDGDWKFKEYYRMPFKVLVGAKPEPTVKPAYHYTRLKYEGLDLTAKNSLPHTKDVSLLPEAVDEEVGFRIYALGLLPQANSKTLFLAAVAYGIVPRHGNAQCAVTTSSVLEQAHKLADRADIAKYFSKAQRDSKEDPLSCTDRVETYLAKLGWNYFKYSAYIAPRGAIALAEGRYSFCGVSKHSGHIYTILTDGSLLSPSSEFDLIADNSGYSRMYGAKTGGFWLPNGVYPLKR